MSETPTSHEGQRRPVDWAISLVVAMIALVLYLTTVCPTVFWYDSAEYATAAAVLGIPHPPGYPLYTLLGRLFMFLPVEPALAVNLLSAVSASVAVALTWWLVRSLGGSRLGASVGAGILAAGQVFWNQAIVAEVYTPGLVVIAGVSLLLLRGSAKNRPGLIILAAGLSGLGLGVHLFVATCGLGFAILVLGTGLDIRALRDLGRVLSREQIGRRMRTAALALLAALVGSCIFLYLPLRASMHPALNFGNPVTWERFWWVVTGGNYKGWFLHDYDVTHRAIKILSLLYDQILLVGTGLAAGGIVLLLRRAPLYGVALLLMAAGNLYMFFDYRVHDVEVFFLPTVLVASVFAGMGVDALLGLVAAHSGRLGQVPRRLLATIMLASPVLMAGANYHAVDLSDYTAAREYGERLTRDLPYGAVILHFTTPPEWKNQAVFGFYFQKVLGARPDVREILPPGPRSVVGLLRAGRPVYLYYPVPRVVKTFVTRKEGVLYRVVRPRGRRSSR